MAQDKKDAAQIIQDELIFLKKKVNSYKKIFLEDDGKINSQAQKLLDGLLFLIQNAEKKLTEINKKKQQKNLVKIEDPLLCEADYDKDILTPGKWDSMEADFKTHLGAWLSGASNAIEQIERRVLSGAKEEDDDDIGLAVISIVMDGLFPMFSRLKIITKLGAKLGPIVAEVISTVAHEISKTILSNTYDEINDSSSNGKISIEDFTDAWITTYNNFIDQSHIYFNQLKVKLIEGCDEITEGVVDQAIKDIVESLPKTNDIIQKTTIFWIKASAKDGYDFHDYTAAKAGHITIRIALVDNNGLKFSLHNDPFIDDVPPGTTKAIIKAFRQKSLLDKALKDLDIQLEFYLFNPHLEQTISIGYCTRENQKWGKYSHPRIKELISKYEQTIAKVARVKDLVPD